MSQWRVATYISCDRGGSLVSPRDFLEGRWCCASAASQSHAGGCRLLERLLVNQATACWRVALARLETCLHAGLYMFVSMHARVCTCGSLTPFP